MTDQERQDSAPREDWVALGCISGLFGVRGWLKVWSWTQPIDNILEYPVWYLRQQGQWRPYKLLDGRPHGKGIVALLDTIRDRDQAMPLLKQDIYVPRDQLPAAPPGEYYWSDLEGLRVSNLDGVEFGVVDHLMETGANDVLVVKGDRERLIPFIQDQVITEVDLANGRITVDWDADF